MSEQIITQQGPTAEAFPEPPDTQAAAERLPGLLNDIQGFIAKYVAMGRAELTALTLWVVHTWVFAAAECTPYVHITSPEKQSGKTRLLEVLAKLVAKPWFTSRVTSAVLVRKVGRDEPTLLLDETDAAFKSDKDYSETLRGVLNAGYAKGGVHSLCPKGKSDWEMQDFSVFCPKALAGIGELPDTIADRSIRISLKRRAPWESVQRFRLRQARLEAEPIRKALEGWWSYATGTLAEAEPALPEDLPDRAQDVWEPLFAIADLAGEDWPSRARGSALALTQASTETGLSLGSRLLSDIRNTVNGRTTGSIATSDLVVTLVEKDEAPWGDLRGKPLDARSLSRFLKPYGIRPKNIRTSSGSGVVKGYAIEDLQDAFQRYLPGLSPESATGATSSRSKSTDVADVAADRDMRGVPENDGETDGGMRI